MKTKAEIIEALWRDCLPDPPPPPPKPKLEAEVLPFPPLLCEQELCRRQEMLDKYWEMHIAAQRELDAEAARSCHRGPLDPDRETRDYDWVWGRRPR
jgi:hypothetical protein